MPETVIVGAGIGGLAAALILGRAGREVLICERDPAPVPESLEEMWSDWPRPGTPQARLGHSFLPGFRRSLAERAPDVLEELVAGGAALHSWTGDMPGEERLAEDAELCSIPCRRGVIEGVMRRAVEAEPTVQVLAGCNVVGLRADPSGRNGAPRVTGVQTKRQGEIPASTVIVGGGRTVPVMQWLERLGAQAPAEFSEGCGFVWFTRYFRVNPGKGEDETSMGSIYSSVDLGFMMYEVAGADASTFCIELGVPVHDAELRGLRTEQAHNAAIGLLPEAAEWIEPGRSEQIGPLALMGQERNVYREFVPDGRPLVLGLHVIGDARCQLNSTYAWGSGMALTEGVTLADLMLEHPDDPEAQALAFEELLGAEIRGRHAASLARDRACLRHYAGEPAWEEPDRGQGLIKTILEPAAGEDAEVFRAVWRWDGQLDHVDALLANTAVVERARALAVERKPAEPAGDTGRPTREALVAVASGA